jgi:hypothetical protein
MISLNGLKDLGVNPGETAAGLYLVENLGDWYGRLRSYAEDSLIAASASFTGGTLQAEIGVSAAAYVTPGANSVKPWVKEWWAVHNFLQYGGGCLVGFTSDSYATSSSSLAGTFLAFDVVFMGDTSDAAYGQIKALVDAKALTDQAVIGVVGVTAQPSSATKITGTENQFYMNVWGNKVHINALGENSGFITTNLTPDVAGCVVRTDRDYKPWYSPAGRVRGRILNLVRLETNPTPAQQDLLYDAGINPVVSFPGEGTVLFGDKTGEVDTSTLSRVNVSRLFLYLRKVIAPVARSILFEQNDEATRARFRLAAESLMRQVLAARGILDYKIVCDASNNPPDLIQARVFVADIFVKPTTAINYVRLTFTNKNLLDTLYPGERVPGE